MGGSGGDTVPAVLKSSNMKSNEGGFLLDVCLPEIVSLPLEGPSLRVALKLKMNVEHWWSDRRTHERNLVTHLGSAAASLVKTNRTLLFREVIVV